MARLLPVLVCLGLGACRSPDPEPSTPTSAAPSTTASTADTARTQDSADATASAGDTAPGALPLRPSWVADPDTPTFVTVTFAPRVGTATLSWTDLAGLHELQGDAELGALRILGVPAGSEVTWSLSADGPNAGDAGPFQSTVPTAPEPLNAWLTTDHGDAETPGHWILTTQFKFRGRSFAVLIDDEGRIRWWREAPPQHRILRIHPGDDGSSLVWASNDADRSADDGLIVREFFDGAAALETTAPRLHHDFVEHPDGFAYLAHVDQDMVLEKGGALKPMTSDVIRLVDEGANGMHSDVFSFFEAWPTSPSQPCNHSVIGNFVPGRIEWTHSNSLVRDPGGDGWWVLPRFLDQVARVHADGRLSHILGGENPTLTHTAAGLPFAHGHMSQVTDAGTLLVFSNGDHEHALLGSKVVELSIDEADGTVDTVWSTPEPEARFVGYLGDARRLPGGHTLVVNPDHGIYEVDGLGQVVWEARHDPVALWDYNLGRVEFVDPLPPYDD